MSSSEFLVSASRKAPPSTTGTWGSADPEWLQYRKTVGSGVPFPVVDATHCPPCCRNLFPLRFPTSNLNNGRTSFRCALLSRAAHHWPDSGRRIHTVSAESQGRLRASPDNLRAPEYVCGRRYTRRRRLVSGQGRSLSDRHAALALNQLVLGLSQSHISLYAGRETLPGGAISR
jgi:hypothetical protein